MTDGKLDWLDIGHDVGSEVTIYMYAQGRMYSMHYAEGDWDDRGDAGHDVLLDEKLPHYEDAYFDKKMAYGRIDHIREEISIGGNTIPKIKEKVIAQLIDEYPEYRIMSFVGNECGTLIY